MTTVINKESRPKVPQDIADIVVSPKSYTDDSVIYPALKWLRENMPLGIAEVDGYDPIWLVTKHADLKKIEMNSKTFLSGVHNAVLTSQAGDEFTRSVNDGSLKVISSLTYFDGQEHAAYRGVTMNWFLPGRVNQLHEQVRALARQSVDHFLSFDGECDFVKDFALHYPLRVIMSIFGVPPEDEPMMLKLTQEFFGGHDPEEQRAEVVNDPVAAAKMWYASLQDFYSYFDDLSAERRRNPTDDLLSHIANATVNGQPIPRDVENGYYVAIATAGHDTTSSTTAGGMHGMIAFPEQFKLLKANPELTDAMINEALRWACPVKHFMRSAASDVEVAGQAIRADERLMLCYPSANRDEALFENPDVFDINRDSRNHIAFGAGPHMCLGQHLAKLEMRILFEELMPHIESIELAGQPKLVETNFVGGYKSLPVKFKKK